MSNLIKELFFVDFVQTAKVSYTVNLGRRQPEMIGEDKINKKNKAYFREIFVQEQKNVSFNVVAFRVILEQ